MKQASLCSSMAHGGGKRRAEGMGQLLARSRFGSTTREINGPFGVEVCPEGDGYRQL